MIRTTSFPQALRHTIITCGLLASMATIMMGVPLHAALADQKMTAVERLTAIEEIRQNKHRYFMSVDGKDWLALRAVFSNDAAIDSGGAAEPGPVTANQFIEGLKQRPQDVHWLHHGHNEIITLSSPTDAEGVWDFKAWVWSTTEPSDTTPPPGQVWGKYKEHYRKTPDGWRITSMIVEVVRQ